MSRRKNTSLIACLALATGFIFMAGYATNAPTKPAVVAVVDLFNPGPVALVSAVNA